MSRGQKKFFRTRKRRKKKTNGSESIYDSQRYQRWRNRVFARDQYQCRMCGARGVYLEAHHILRKADFPHLTYKVSNGITLCKACHTAITGREYEFAVMLKQLINSPSLSLHESLSV